jgi:serine/threonine protein kinase
MVPAKQLVGLTLEDTWRVTELLERRPGATGGCFSQSYHVVAADGRKAFLKALDYTEALTKSEDPARVLAALTTAYNYERDLLAKCKGRRMSRVVTILADGKVRVSDSIDGTVQYLIFEEATHDARSRMGSGEQFDLALRLRALHHVATGIRQLHGLEIAHQDLKPSNVLMFDDCSKVGDLGCASQKGTTAPRDTLAVPGDPTYAPPELLYHSVPLDWNPRRYACDLYLLGSMVAYFFTGLGMTQLWVPHLHHDHRPYVWRGTYAEVLPFVRDAFCRAIEIFGETVRPKTVGRLLSRALRELCDPEPERRGHPMNRRGVPGSEYSVERYVAEFDLLAGKAAIGEFND